MKLIKCEEGWRKQKIKEVDVDNKKFKKRSKLAMSGVDGKGHKERDVASLI